MGMDESQGQLTRAMKDLLAQWRRTSESWNDPASAAFAEKYLEPLETDVRLAISALANMNQVLGRIRRDCEKDR